MTAFSFSAEPPREVPPEYWNEFTWNGEIPVSHWYFNSTCDNTQPTIYTKEAIDALVAKATLREVNYYGKTDEYLYKAFSEFPIAGKEVAIIGSTIPWYEAMVLSFGGKPVTIEYNKIITNHPSLEVMTVDQYAQNPRTFDVVLSVSSLEHDGLGRYGDPINPNGDIQWMQRAKDMLKENGLLILSIPVGTDRVFWNAHRQYGEKRLKRIFEGWERIADFGFSPSDLTVNEYTGHQPVFILTPLHSH